MIIAVKEGGRDVVYLSSNDLDYLKTSRQDELLASDHVYDRVYDTHDGSNVKWYRYTNRMALAIIARIDYIPRYDQLIDLKMEHLSSILADLRFLANERTENGKKLSRNDLPNRNLSYLIGSIEAFKLAKHFDKPILPSFLTEKKEWERDLEEKRLRLGAYNYR